MNTNTERAADVNQSKYKTGVLFLLTLLITLPLSETLNAQPIDLCSYPNGIELEIGGIDQITVQMSAYTTLRVTILEECDPERSVDSDGGVYFTGSDAPSPDFQWVTGPKNTPSNAGVYDE